MPKRRGNNEGTIAQRADGRWEAKLSLDDGRRKSLYGKTRAEVQRKLTAALAARDEGLPVVADGRTALGAYLSAWLADLRDRSAVRPSTRISYEGHVRRNLVPVIGKIALTKLTPAHVRAVHARGHSRGLAPRSVAYAHAVLRRALNQALRDGLVGRNVATLEPAPGAGKFEGRTLDPAGARALLAAARGDRLEALYVVATALGLRQGEALGLTWDDVDSEAGTVAVRRTLQRLPRSLRAAGQPGYVLAEPKTAAGVRTVHAPAFVTAALREHRNRQRAERLAAGPAWDTRWNLVFATSAGTPLDGRNVTRAFVALLARAGLPRMRFHDLRHSAATLLLAQGVPMHVVQRILGHASMTTTHKFYAHVIADQQRDAADRLESLFGA